jgi:hypothetical protein
VTTTMRSASCQSENADGSLSDSDSDVSIDDDGCWSKAEKQGGLSMKMNIL